MARPPSYRPHEVSLGDQAAVIVADLLYDGLTEAVGLEGRLRPALATEWESSPDLQTWVFSVDLRRIDAYRVADHFQALLADTGNPAVAPLLADVIEVAALNPTEVAFTLSQPGADLAWRLSGLGLSVVGPEGLPTGRYLIESATDETMVLIPDLEVFHWPTVEVTWTASADEAYDRLVLGLADAAVGSPDHLDDAAERFGASPPARSISLFYGIQRQSPRLDDPRLVEAVLHGVDRLEVVGAGAFATDGVLAPSLAGYSAGACGEPCRYDPDRAAALVAEVVDERGGHPGDSADPIRPVRPELTMVYAGEEQALVAEAIAADLRRAGFDVAVLAESPEGLAEAVASGRADLFAFGWMAGAGSIDAVVAPLFASDSGANMVGLRSAEVDALVEAARQVTEDNERWSLLLEAHRLALVDQHLLPLGVVKSHLVVAPQAAGAVVRADGSIDVEASE